MNSSANPLLQALAQGRRDLPLPTTLTIVLRGVTLDVAVESVLRLLPKKRVVLRGMIYGKPVLIKLYTKNFSSARNTQREIAGYDIAKKAGVRCAALLGRFLSPCNRFEGLVYEFIEEAVDLSQRWPQLNDTQKSYWLREIVQLSLLLHRAGAIQSDIHPGNFLLKDGQLYLVDLGSILIRTAPLSQTACLTNLGQLAAQLKISERALLNESLHWYFSQQQWPNHERLQRMFDRKTRHAWRKRLCDYLAKSTRNCTLTSFAKTWREVRAYRRTWASDDLEKFFRDPDRFMKNGTPLKVGNTATVVKAIIDNKTVVIKRYNIKNWRHAISRSLRPTRAEHSWRYAHILEIAGINSLQPIALLEKRAGPLRGEAYFISSWIDAPDLLSIGRQRALAESELHALRLLLSQMIACRLSHGDFKANNLLLDGDKMAVIDLDAMQRHTDNYRFWRAFHKDLARLLRNWPEDSPVFAQINEVIAGAAKIETMSSNHV